MRAKAAKRKVKMERCNRGGGEFTLLFRYFDDSYLRKPWLEVSFPSGKQQNCLEWFPGWEEGETRAEVRASCGEMLVLQLDTEICICNTLTKEWRFLPRPPAEPEYMLRWGPCALICKDNNFKVVMVRPRDTNILMTRVFCSQSGRWTDSRAPLPDQVEAISINCVSANGNLYSLFGNKRNKCRGVVAYDPSNDAALYIDLPPGCRGTLNRIRLFVVRGHLCLSHLSWDRTAKAYSFKLWELHNDNSRWCLVRDFRPTLPPRPMAFVLAFHPYDRDTVFLHCNYSDVCRYHIARDALEVVAQLPSNDIQPFLYAPLLQTFTLASPADIPNNPLPADKKGTLANIPKKRKANKR